MDTFDRVRVEKEGRRAQRQRERQPSNVVYVTEKAEVLWVAVLSSFSSKFSSHRSDDFRLAPTILSL